MRHRWNRLARTATRVVTVALLGLAPRPGWAAEPVELELVLAVDCSSSVNWEEFRLQLTGLAVAWRHPAVAGAIQALGGAGIAVAVLQWSGGDRQVLAVEWTRVRTPAEAAALAARIEATGRLVIGGVTALGTALGVAAEAIAGNRYEGRRRVIDVSGDGRANQGPQPVDMRERLVARGFVINGLAIRNEHPALDAYYRDDVVGGPGAFVMDARDYEAFPAAILQKLVREISGGYIAAVRPDPQVAGRPAERAGPGVEGGTAME